MPLLSASAVPDLSYTTRALSASALARDTSIPGVTSRLSIWGYLDGRERTFQGESRHLTLVVSRYLAFKDDAGARSFVSFVHENSLAYFGGGVTEQALSAQGHSGWIFTLAPCACHMASPAFVGLVGSGTGVTWLEINGPDATSALLVSLLGA